MAISHSSGGRQEMLDLVLSSRIPWWPRTQPPAFPEAPRDRVRDPATKHSKDWRKKKKQGHSQQRNGSWRRKAPWQVSLPVKESPTKQGEKPCHIPWQTGPGIQTAMSESSQAPTLEQIWRLSQHHANSARPRQHIYRRGAKLSKLQQLEIPKTTVVTGDWEGEQWRQTEIEPWLSHIPATFVISLLYLKEAKGT